MRDSVWLTSQLVEWKLWLGKHCLLVPETSRETARVIKERPWEKILFILLWSLDFYKLQIAFCVWLIGVCVASAPFVPVVVFTLVSMCLLWHEFWLYACVCVGRAPRFKGYQQQDSQELLHYLLDSVRVEETKVSVCFENLCLKCSCTERKNKTFSGWLTPVV